MLKRRDELFYMLCDNFLLFISLLHTMTNSALKKVSKLFYICFYPINSRHSPKHFSRKGVDVRINFHTGDILENMQCYKKTLISKTKWSTYNFTECQTRDKSRPMRAKISQGNPEILDPDPQATTQNNKTKLTETQVFYGFKNKESIFSITTADKMVD